jgi:hypothetical protein
VATVDTPRDEDVRRLRVVLVCNLLDDLVLDEERRADGVVAETRVGGDDDVLLLVVLDEVELNERGVALDLRSALGSEGERREKCGKQQDAPG